MNALIQLLQHLAVLALVGMGFSMIVGWSEMRERFFRLTAALFFASFAIPYLVAALGEALGNLSVSISVPWIALPDGLGGLVVLGHVVLFIVLVRRRFRDPAAVQREMQTQERVRSRERTRLPLETTERP